MATLHHATCHIDPRTALHIPEKIIGGVIDIVHNHKNKPLQTTTQQYPANTQQNYQYPQYQQWNPQGNYQGQGQYQGQYQGQNQAYYPQAVGTYPQNNAPATYPQPVYPVNQYPAQNGGTQSQMQGQYQYPQNAGQFQGQTQQGNGVYQGQTQQQGQVQTGQNQYPAQSQFQGQNQGTGQYTGQTSQFQGQNQATGQYGGQEMTSGQFQGTGGTQTGSQTSGFQVSGGQNGNQGPTCVCQAWTKPNAVKGDVGAATLEKADKADL